MATQTRTETFWKINLNLKNARPWHWAQLSLTLSFSNSICIDPPALPGLAMPCSAPPSQFLTQLCSGPRPPFRGDHLHLPRLRDGIPRLDEPLPALPLVWGCNLCCMCFKLKIYFAASAPCPCPCPCPCLMPPLPMPPRPVCVRVNCERWGMRWKIC